MPLTNEAYISQLETDKADLLAQVTNYVKEQKLAVTAFKAQGKLLTQKDQQLTEKDQLISEKEEAITKLKVRISQLVKSKQVYATTIHSDSESKEEILKTNATTQTDGITPIELEEQLFKKRVENLKDFGDYQAKLTKKNEIITQLKHQLTLYQSQIKKLKTHTNPNKDKLTILISLVVIVTILLIFK